ncbi:MAG: hypothetical protein U0Y82_00770 [Thermoleophilia bacterium]
MLLERHVRDHDGLLERLEQALETGEITPREVESLLAHGQHPGGDPPTASGVLYTLGAVGVFSGLAIAYGTVFGDLPRTVRMATPYLFPLVALGACIWLAHRGFARWQSDLSGLVGYAALAGAVAASGAASGWVNTGDDVAWLVTVAGLGGVAVVLAVRRATGSEILFGVGLPAALVTAGTAGTYLLGLWESDASGNQLRLGWVVLAEAALAAITAGVLAQRSPVACRFATVWATLGGYAAIVFAGDDLGRFTIWHVVLAGVVIAAFLAAAALDFDALIWLAAVGGAWWVVMIAVVVGSATGAALAVVLAGVGLIGLGLLVARLRRVVDTA